MNITLLSYKKENKSPLITAHCPNNRSYFLKCYKVSITRKPTSDRGLLEEAEVTTTTNYIRDTLLSEFPIFQ